MMTDEGTVGLMFAPGDINGLVSVLLRSVSLDLADEREKTLKQFRSKLSPDAIAQNVIHVINA
jgi:hypothetical protein